jgi:hypothetical protein
MVFGTDVTSTIFNAIIRVATVEAASKSQIGISKGKVMDPENPVPITGKLFLTVSVNQRTGIAHKNPKAAAADENSRLFLRCMGVFIRLVLASDIADKSKVRNPKWIVGCRK